VFVNASARALFSTGSSEICPYRVPGAYIRVIPKFPAPVTESQPFVSTSYSSHFLVRPDAERTQRAVRTNPSRISARL
jgi:hypothetical protein